MYDQHAVEQPRRPRARVGADLDVRDRHALLAGLDDRLERVRELRDDRHPQRGLARVGAEPAGRVRHLRARHLPHDPAAEALQQLLLPGHVLEIADVAVADHDVGLAARGAAATSRAMSLAGVLIVGVGVDDDSRRRACRLASMPAMNAAARPLRRRNRTTWCTPCARATSAVSSRRPVVDDERLDDVDARHRPRQIGQRRRQRRRPRSGRGSG